MLPAGRLPALIENPNYTRPYMPDAYVIRLSGRAFLDGYPLKIGDNLFLESNIITREDSVLEVQMEDESILKFGTGTNARISVQNTGTYLKLKSGSITSVITDKNRVPYYYETDYLNLQMTSSVSYFERISEKSGFVGGKRRNLSINGGGRLLFLFVQWGKRLD